MTARAVEATAPTRIDLAGGTLDIWPLYLFHPGAVTVNAAIDRRAWCRVETGHEGVRIESKDTLAQGGRPRRLGGAAGQASSRWSANILRALGIETGVKVVTQSRVPSGSGLGGSSALSVAVAAALRAAFDRKIDPDELWPVVRDAEAQTIGVPTGVQDYLAAIHGGVLGIHLEPGTLRVEKLATDPARVEESPAARGLRGEPLLRHQQLGGLQGPDRRRATASRSCLGEIVAAAKGDARGAGHGPLRRRRRLHGGGDGVADAAGSRRLLARRSTGSRKPPPPRAARPRCAGRAGAGWSRCGRRRAGARRVEAAVKTAGFKPVPVPARPAGPRGRPVRSRVV